MGGHSRQRAASGRPGQPARTDPILGPVVRDLQTHGGRGSQRPKGGRRDHGRLCGGKNRRRPLLGHRTAIRCHCPANYGHRDSARATGRLDAGAHRRNRVCGPTEPNCGQRKTAWRGLCPDADGHRSTSGRTGANSNSRRSDTSNSSVPQRQPAADGHHLAIESCRAGTER